VVVESSPRYVVHPLVPYRMKMVMPLAKIIIVLRDPTERWGGGGMDVRVGGIITHSRAYYTPNCCHQPTRVPNVCLKKKKKAEKAYTPYTPLCQGVNATTEDLWDCWMSMQRHLPLVRGLYADQLERWFRVYDRSQVM
ncbi:unnamed protein product, partial [Discosporangium mesarthrocarpum]